MRRFATPLLVAAVAAIAVAASPAFAAGVSKLVVSSSEDASDAKVLFPAGTTEIYVVFEYVDMGNQEISVEIDGPNLPRLYESAGKRYTGDGTDSVKISGSQLYAALTGRVSEQALTTQSNIGLATDQSVVYGYLSAAMGNVSEINSSLALLLTLDDSNALASAQLQQMMEIADAATEIEDLLTQALDASVDISTKKALAGQMQAPAATMVSNARELVTQAESVGSMPLPDTGPDAVRGFTVQAKVNGELSDSTEIAVSGEPVSPDESSLPSPTASGSAGGVVRVTATRPTRSGAGQPTTPPSSGSSSSGGGDSSSGSQSSTGSTGSESASGTGGQRTATGGLSVFRSTTATPMTRPGRAENGSIGISGSELAESAPASAGEDETVDQSESPAGAPEGQPTWTPRPRSGSGGQPAEATGDEDADLAMDMESGGSGPNLAIVVVGAIVLAALAVWLRRSA